jgi:hypothetical protein
MLDFACYVTDDELPEIACFCARCAAREFDDD